MAFKLSLVADVKGWLKGTQDVEQSLDSLAGSLDGLAQDTKQDSSKAADDLSHEFSQAFDKVKTEARTAGRAIGDDVKDGSRRAGDGMDDLKDNAHSNAKEVAASFDGSMESIADGFQGLAAEAFEGFGPAGKAAGVAIALGMGIAIQALQEQLDKTNASKDAANDLTKALASGDPNDAVLQYLDNVRDKLLTVSDANMWQMVTGNMPISDFEKLSQMATQFGVDHKDMAKAIYGDTQAMADIQEQLTQKYRDEMTLFQQGDQVAADRAGAVMGFRTELEAQNKTFADAKTQADAWNESFGDVGGNMSDAAEASKDFSENLTDNLSVADEGLGKFVKKGKLKVSEWTNELKERAADNKTVKTFVVDMEAELSPKALESFAKLPVETQVQIAKAYNSGGKKTRQKVVANLEAEAKIDKVDIKAGETKGAKVEIPTTVVTTGLPKEVQGASNKAQSEANKSGNRIEFKTNIDAGKLQREVNRAAASITSPTIYVNVKPRKDVP